MGRKRIPPSVIKETSLIVGHCVPRGKHKSLIRHRRHRERRILSIHRFVSLTGSQRHTERSSNGTSPSLLPSLSHIHRCVSTLQKDRVYRKAIIDVFGINSFAERVIQLRQTELIGSSAYDSDVRRLFKAQTIPAGIRSRRFIIAVTASPRVRSRNPRCMRRVIA